MNMFSNNQYQPYQPYRPMNNGITWVQGIEGAKAYQIMPNSNALLMDSDNDNIFYIKVSDNVGMCNLRTFKYEEITNFGTKDTPNVDLGQYVRKDELEKLLNDLLGGNNGKSIISTTQSTDGKA